MALLLKLVGQNLASLILSDMPFIWPVMFSKKEGYDELISGAVEPEESAGLFSGLRVRVSTGIEVTSLQFFPFK
jgi:hypothetical protein